ncbi:inositol monophosphatase family protein [Peterkaempfera bronchialis]|uniref:inositol monophosphatase family protein n=1 Tax=Peterkaempfera bronchialis TaxID=2126346 RepID=UPI003C2C28CC
MAGQANSGPDSAAAGGQSFTAILRRASGALDGASDQGDLHLGPHGVLPDDAEAVRRTGASLSDVLPHVMAVRNLGPVSLQLAHLAAGRVDAFWQYGPDQYNWLAGALLAREAGAEVTDAAGQGFDRSSGSIAMAVPGPHREPLGALATVHRW